MPARPRRIRRRQEVEGMRAEAPAGDLDARELIDAILAERPLRAGAFIVTLYGDVVVPRGGTLWIGNLIETCAEVGINESLVRTAVSRLVAAGRLEGERDGRRSFYRLTEAAREEFERAAILLFGGRAASGDWRFVHFAGPAPGDALERAGYARIAPRFAVSPWSAEPVPDEAGALVFRAEPAGGRDALRAFAAELWRLDEHAEAYAAFLRLFDPLAACLEAGRPPPGRTCLIARLVLVNEFRKAALADPRLPADALPDDWPGEPARRLFARLYLRLSEGADSHVEAHFVDARGPLRAVGDALVRRRAALATP
jgi:phenylacetic acid degradation operon negative regulatory protein